MKRVERVLVYVDDLENIKGVLNDIVQLAGEEKVSVTFAGVVEPVSWWSKVSGGPTVEDCISALASELEEGIAEAISSLKSQGVDAEVKVFTGDPTKVLVQAINQDGYDLLIKAPQVSEGNTLAGIDQRLLRFSPCPVALLRPKRSDSTGKIIAAVDFDPDDPEEKGPLNDEVLDAAVRASTGGFGEINILHVWQLFGESMLSGGFSNASQEDVNKAVEAEKKLHEDWLESYTKDFFAKLGPETTEYLQPRSLLVKGNAKQVIPQQVEDLKADLLILGTIGRAGASGFFMGNTSESIVNQVKSSILAVKLPGFKPSL